MEKMHALFSKGLFVLMLFFASCHSYYFRSAQTDGGIHHFQMLEVNDIHQAVLIRGQHINNPVLVYMHGGPGFPLFPFEPNHEIFRLLEQHFTMVYWEQRGTGKSFSKRIPARTMNIHQFVEDAKIVIDFALAFAGQQKAFIWGHSWGSGVATLFSYHHPDRVRALITTGQTVNPFLNEQMGYEFVYERATLENNKRALRQLQWIDTIPENYTLQDALTIRRWVYHYGGIVKEVDRERPYINMGEIQEIISAPEYSFLERLNLVFFPMYSARKLWDDMKSMNLFDDVAKIRVPVYFLLGRHDIIVSSRLAASYYAELEAPAGKKLVWFESSAHRPFIEEKDKFMEVVLSIRNHHVPNDSPK